MNTNPTLSIIIVSWNTRDLLAACLTSIRVTAGDIVPEVIVVDNASADGSSDMVSSEFPEFTVIRSKENLGFAGANNIGMRQARGRYVMLLNSDAELTPGSASRMIEYIERHPDVGLIAPKLVSPDGTLQINGQKFPTLAREILGVLRAPRFFPGLGKLGWGREDFDVNADVDSLAGACMLVRREVVDTVGGLDEQFFMYFEDVDWCLRIKKAGWRIHYVGEVQIVHGWAQSSAKQGLVKAHGMLHASRYLYFRKHHGPVQGLIIRAVSGLELAAFAFKYRDYDKAGGQ
jgi:N-acetylglucosaminyl-diphospho-decaprenol L-rhamnosyltransferase